MEVESCRDGNVYRQTYARGKATSELSIVGECNGRTGSRTLFKPDRIFSTKWSQLDTLEYRLREMAFLNRGIRIVLKDEREGRKSPRRSTTRRHPRVRQPEPEQRRHPPRHHLLRCRATTGKWKSRCSTRPLQRNDPFVCTHQYDRRRHPWWASARPLRACSTSTPREINSSKKTKRGSPAKISGAAAILSVKLMQPQFEGRTKTKLGNPTCADLWRRRPTNTSWRSSKKIRSRPGSFWINPAGRPRPGSGEEGARADEEERALDDMSLPGSWRTVRKDPPFRKSSSWKATRPAVRPSRAAIVRAASFAARKNSQRGESAPG